MLNATLRAAILSRVNPWCSVGFFNSGRFQVPISACVIRGPLSHLIHSQRKVAGSERERSRLPQNRKAGDQDCDQEENNPQRRISGRSQGSSRRGQHC
jgi:hypothetical protein